MKTDNHPQTAHRAGFVSILGNPNAGKSTLMNALLGEKLSIVTPKAQTTRHRIMGILNGLHYQIVYSDTPGAIDARYKLQEGMMKAVNSSFRDADLFLVVIDLKADEPLHASILTPMEKSKVPVFIVLNKFDAVEREVSNRAFQFWSQKLPMARIYPVSALHKIYTAELLDEIVNVLPESPPYFPKDEMSDRPVRFFVSEIIREKIFMVYEREVPYSCEVIIEQFKEEPEIVRISATIITERESQKRILIGHKGAMLKRTGTMARKEIESFVGKKVFLELFVKVDENWRNDLSRLKNMGYWE